MSSVIHMLYKDFKNTKTFLNADVVNFVDSDGIEMDIANLDDAELNNKNVVVSDFNNGYLEIMLVK